MAQKDRRYSITGEFTGKSKKQFVIRFCGTYVGEHATRDLAEKEVAERKATGNTPMVKPSWQTVEAV
jgi:hypothetical protein